MNLHHRTEHTTRGNMPAQRQGHGFRGDSSGQALRGDQGLALVLTGLLLIPLMGLTALAVDIGVWYAQAARIQRAADLAAMAAVVHLPDTAASNTAMQQALTQNGFTLCTSPCSSPPPALEVVFAAPPSGSLTQYKVTLKQNANRYFSNVLQTSQQTLQRSATAEFNKPVPLGSPNNNFGNNLPGAPTCINPQAACAGSQPMLWAAIQGPYEAFQNGDPYTTKCAGDTETVSTCSVPSNPNGAQNPLYRTSGYLWAVDVPASLVGTPITVQLYDAVHCDSSIQYRNASGSAAALCPNAGSGSTRDNYTGDSTGGANYMMDMEFEVFDSDGSDLTIDTSPALSMNGRCSAGPGRLLIDQTTAFPTPYMSGSSATEIANNNTRIASANTYKNTWATLCTFVPTKSGIHPMRVKSSAISGQTDSGSGYNAYAWRAQANGGVGTQPQTYALNDMSMWNNASSSIAKFYLAQIGPEHKGKRLVLDLYDPGDGGGSSAFTMQFRTPPGGIPNPIPQPGAGTTSCDYNATPSTNPGPATPNNSATCTITTKNAGSSSGIYNSKWLRVVIQIPTTYTCSSDCWWSVWYNFVTGSPTDRTVWAIQVIGDPVHLIN